jgi:pantoate kinase
MTPPLIRIPLHVSGIWYPIHMDNPLYTGSIGAGLNLELYLVVQSIEEDRCSILLNNEFVLREHAEIICNNIGLKISVREYSPIGLGIGYGVSAASLIGLSMSKLLIHDKPDTTLERSVWPAHIAEVLKGTGLGDVIAEYYGGVEIRVKPGPPGIGMVEHIFPRKKPCILASILPGKITTPLMLKMISPETYSFGKKLLEKLLEEPVLEKLFEYSNMFTRRIFDYSFIDKVLGRYRGRIIGYYRKKQALIVWVEDEWFDEIHGYLNSYFKTFKTSIDYMGARIVYSTKSST